MKKSSFFKTIAMLFALCTVLVFSSKGKAYADIASGTCGTCQWVIDNNGTLTIKSGTLASYTDYSSANNIPWRSYKTSIKKVVINTGVKTSTGCYGLFANLTACTQMNMSNLNTSAATIMSQMFYNCSSLTSLDLSNFNTSSVAEMNMMFESCSSLKTLLTGNNFKTNNVTRMSSMFNNCSSLTALDISGFNTSNVTTMNDMFRNCSSLTALDISGFNTSNVTTMSGMFYNCNKVTYLNVSGFNTSKVTDMSNMFNQCNKLASLDVSGFDTSRVTTMHAMFNATDLAFLDVSNFNTSLVTSMSYMFGYCKMTSLDLGSFDTRNVTNIKNMFYDCSNLASITLSANFNFVVNSNNKAILPNPPTTDPYTGKWIKEDRTAGSFTSTELRDQYAANAGEWSGTWVWEVPPTTYRIAFSIPNGVSGAMAVQEVESDQAYTLEGQHLYKFGYTFNNWQVDGSATTYQDRATIPANTYTAGTTVTLIPVFEAIDTTLNMVNGEMDLYLYGNEKATFDDLPAGTAYEVWEETPSGWRLVSQSNVSGTIEPLQTSTASFINEYAPGTVTATICGSKILDGKAAPAGAYQFQLLENGSIIQTVYNQAGGFIAFDPITYTGAGNHTYTVREINGGDSSIQYDSHTETITVSVTQDGDGVLQASVTYDSDGINFVNTTRPGVLEIIKQAIGLTQANSNSTFTFNVILQNGDGTLNENGYAWHVENAS